MFRKNQALTGLLLLVGTAKYYDATAFSPRSVSFSHKSSSSSNRMETSLYYEGSSDFSGGGENDKIEQARQQLEAMLAGANDPSSSLNGNLNSQQMEERKLPMKDFIKLISDPKNSQNFGAILPPPTPLTTAENERRLAELKLLELLASTDDALHELMFLWMSEKGPEAHEQLVHVDQFLASGQIIAAEQMLLKLLKEYDDTDSSHYEIFLWSEPLMRLARLRSQQGRLQDAYQLCLCVLHLKPWHFGALDTIVDISMKRGNRDQARTWAGRSLPKLIASTSFPPFTTNGPANPKRAEWARQAIQQAQEALSHMEYQTQRDFMGLPEEYYVQSSGKEEGGTNSASSSSTDSSEGKLPDGNNVLDISTQQVIVEDDDLSWQ